MLNDLMQGFMDNHLKQGLGGGDKALSLEVAILVWQGWSVGDIAKQLGLAVERLEADYGRELLDGKKIVEGRIVVELVKRGLTGDDKSLHLLARSKFGFAEPKESAVQVNVGVGLPPGGDNVLVETVEVLGESGFVNPAKLSGGGSAGGGNAGGAAPKGK